MLANFEYFLEVCGECLCLKFGKASRMSCTIYSKDGNVYLNTETMIGCDCYTVLARHCDDATTIISHDRHLG